MQNSKDGTILIIGNGFDLHCKLPSKFDDFFKKVVIDKNELGRYCLKDYSNIWYILLFFEFYNYDNAHSLFGINADNDFGWMNVESFIKRIMVEKCECKTCLKYFDRRFNECLFDLYNNRNDSEYLFSVEEARTIKKHFRAIPFIDSINELNQYMYKQLLSFEKSFSAYLNKAVSETELYDKSVKSLADKLLSKTGLHCYVLDFNYTKPESLTNNKHFIINNVHGSLTDNNIIIGFDGSDLSEKYKSELNFSKSWRKMLNKNSNVPLPEKESVSSIIFYGHSLGDEDYSYFHALFDIYDIFSSDIKLVFCYSDYDQNKNIKEEYITKIQLLLNKYVSSTEKEKQNKTIINKLQLENRLSVVRI